MLFEGASEGKGQLTLVIFDQNNNEICEGPSVWIDIRNIKEMYLRGVAAPQPPYPYRSTNNQPPAPNITCSIDDSGHVYPFEPDPNEDTKNPTEIVFVHGFNQDYAHSTNYAETVFKRLWQRGYRGRFASFRWPTYGSGLTVAGIPISAMGTYNDSEYVAWSSGAALKQFVQQNMFGYNVNIVAHSMGNIVVGEALRQGMTVGHYAMLHAATSASCYDDRTSYPATNDYAVPDNTPNLPDGTPDLFTRSLGYSGYLGRVGGEITNFYDTSDATITLAWNANNATFRPQWGLVSVGGAYHYAPDASSGEKLNITIPATDVNPRTIRYVVDPSEAKAYVDQSLTGAIGGVTALAGSVSSNVNQNVFGNDHSYEWSHPLQDANDLAFYNALLRSFLIAPIQ